VVNQGYRIQKGMNLLEQRKFQRLNLQGKAFAALQPDYTKVGRIIDISREGFSFRYLLGRSDEHLQSKNSNVELYSLFTIDQFILNHVPAIIISDSKINDREISIRRRSLEFIDLSSKQASQLDYFIALNTINRFSTERIALSKQLH
jgi:hypothetical protein